MEEKNYDFGVDAGSGKVIHIILRGNDESEAWRTVKSLVYQAHAYDAIENFIYLFPSKEG